MNTHPENVLKNCQRCGSNAISYQKDNALQCRSCGFCYYINSAAAVAIVIVNKQGELLLTKRALEPQKGKLDLPGGFVTIGESAEKAVRRELQEELNLKAQNLTYFGSYPNEYVYSGLTIYTLDMAFFCEVSDFKEITPKDDVLSYEFVAIDSLDYTAIAFYSIREIIKDFIHIKNKL